MLGAVWRSDALSVAPALEWRRSQKVFHRIKCCSNKELEKLICVKEEKNEVWRGAGIFLGTAALCMVSGLASFQNVANAVEPLTSRMPEFERKLKQKQGRTKVPARELRRKIREKRLAGVLAKIDEEPENVVAHKALLRLRMEKGEVKEAVEVLERLVELQPGDLELKFMKARTYQVVGDREKARVEFEKLVKLLPFSAKALQGLVLSMPNWDDDSILEMIKSAARHATEQGQSRAARDFRMLLGQLLAMRDKISDALEQYEELIRDDPTDYRPYICQGLMYDLLGKQEEAMKCYRKYRMLCPRTLPKRKFLDDLLIEGSLRSRLKEEGKEDQMQMRKPDPLTDEDYTTLLKQDEEP